MAFRAGLFAEVVVMAFDTVRTNKMRSFLTVLGVVIGITSIVGMTALIRGFDQSLRDLIAQSGPDIIYLQRFGVSSIGTEDGSGRREAKPSRNEATASTRAKVRPSSASTAARSADQCSPPRARA